MGGYTCEFSRGASPGELYLLTWHEPVHYKLFRSTDYGETFTFQSEQQGTAYAWDEKYYITGGRAPGEVYIIKLKVWVEGYYFRLHVFYSTDYGVTFNEYIHEMDENWNGIASVENIKQNNLISIYPNPCTNYTTFNIPDFNKYNISRFDTSAKVLNASNLIIDIFNIYGQYIQSIPVKNQYIIFNTSALSAGSYIYRLKTNDTYSEANKLIIINNR